MKKLIKKTIHSWIKQAADCPSEATSLKMGQPFTYKEKKVEPNKSYKLNDYHKEANRLFTVIALLQV